jgi:hypothetical protein
LSWSRQVFLLYVEVCGIHDVFGGGPGAGDDRDVYCDDTGWQAEEGDRVEDFDFFVDAGGNTTMCCYGYCGM